MSKQLIWAVLVLVLFIVLLPVAERALLQLTHRRLDRSRRVVRSFLFLLGVAAWGYGSYLRWYSRSSGWWFVCFLVVAGVLKLVIDVLIFGVPDRARTAGTDRK